VGWRQRGSPCSSEADGGGQRLRVVHIVLVERGKNIAGVGAGGPAETIGSHIKTAVVPTAKLAVVRKRIVRNCSLIYPNRIKPPAAGNRVGGLGCGKTLIQGRIPGGGVGNKSEIGEDPSVRQLVVNDDRVPE